MMENLETDSLLPGVRTAVAGLRLRVPDCRAGLAPSRHGLRRCVLVALACIVAVHAVSGCSRAKRGHKRGVFKTRRDVALCIREALEHQDADVRRGAINELAELPHPSEPTLRTFHLVAQTDSSDAVRCAALRGLSRRGGLDSLPTMLRILETTARESGRERAGGKVRWEAVRGLLEQVHRAHVDDATAAAIRETAMRLLASDPSRDVRLQAARLLGSFPAMESLRALIDALRQRDFGIVYEAERALMRLTGQTHEHDPARWQRWLTATVASDANPFAQRGTLDGTLDPPADTGWWPW